MSEAEASGPANAKAHAEWLRQQAREHPVVKELLDRLPPFRGPKIPHEPGLYMDAEDAPSISVKREVRVSVVRVFSVNSTDIQLVGQIQCTTAPSDVKLWALRFYVHSPTQFLTKEIHDHNHWWLGVLERHYGRGGPPVAIQEHVKA
ncbi:MAG TPA: hypothetical protein VGR28_11165 [Candidatus Thermoplasmatota archaeon]|jgi:hypothetical protein|nr:hypothetical protein [Candidatus Thermoplasmatota archaeon]